MSDDTKDAALHYEIEAEREIGEDIPDIKDSLEEPQNEPGAVREHSGATTKTSLSLYDQMASEWLLSSDELTVLVRPPTDGGPITLPMVKRLLTASRRYAVPISTLMEIKEKKGRITLYFTADAIRWRVFTDSRGFSSSTTDIVHMPDVSKEKDYIAVKAIITMKDGSVGEGLGISEWPPETKAHRSWALGDLVMKLETKATRRAGIKLVGANLPIFDEDYYGWKQTNGKGVIEGDFAIEKPKQLKPKKENPTVLSELLTMALRVDGSLTAGKLMEMMEVSNLTDLDIDKTWERVKEEERNG